MLLLIKQSGSMFCVVCSIMSCSLGPHGLQPTRLLCPWDFPDQNTGVGCHSLLLGIFPDPGIEPAFPASLALAGGFFTAEPLGRSLSSMRRVAFLSSVRSLPCVCSSEISFCSRFICKALFLAPDVVTVTTKPKNY